jgi:hypothetical protein
MNINPVLYIVCLIVFFQWATFQGKTDNIVTLMDDIVTTNYTMVELNVTCGEELPVFRGEDLLRDVAFVCVKRGQHARIMYYIVKQTMMFVKDNKIGVVVQSSDVDNEISLVETKFAKNGSLITQDYQTIRVVTRPYVCKTREICDGLPYIV